MDVTNIRREAQTIASEASSVVHGQTRAVDLAAHVAGLVERLANTLDDLALELERREASL